MSLSLLVACLTILTSRTAIVYTSEDVNPVANQGHGNVLRIVSTAEDDTPAVEQGLGYGIRLKALIKKAFESPWPVYYSPVLQTTAEDSTPDSQSDTESAQSPSYAHYFHHNDHQNEWWSWFVISSCIITAISSSAIAINLQWRAVGMTWTRVVGSLFVILFIISIPWTWVRLYQEELVRKMTISSLPKPKECNPQSMSIFQSFISSFHIGDKCERFYASLHIDPLVDVPPTKAIAVTVSKFVLEPLQHLGEAVSKMVTTCLKDLPIHLYPVVLPILLLVWIMLLVMGFGYKIHLFHLFGLEPSKTPMLQLKPKDRMMLQNISQRLDYIQLPRKHYRSSKQIRRIWR